MTDWTPNPPVDPEDLVATIGGVPGVTVTDEDPWVVVDVGDAVPALRLDPDRVIAADVVAGPADRPAARVVMESINYDPPELVVYVTAGDVAFAPDARSASRELATEGLVLQMPELPSGVSYREMVREFRRRPRTDNLDHLHGWVVTLCAFWWGAERVGLDVTRLRRRLNRHIAELRRL